jgi:hypothetical protein
LLLIGRHETGVFVGSIRLLLLLASEVIAGEVSTHSAQASTKSHGAQLPARAGEPRRLAFLALLLLRHFLQDLISAIRANACQQNGSQASILHLSFGVLSPDGVLFFFVEFVIRHEVFQFIGVGNLPELVFDFCVRH